MGKRLASTTIECASAEITLTAEILPGSRATRDEPGAAPEINQIVSAVREDACRNARCVVTLPRHTHAASIDADALETILGVAAWAEIEEALIDAAMDQDDEGPDPDDARDQAGDR